MASLFSRPNDRSLRFGRYELSDPPLRLRHRGAPVDLTAQPLKLLHLLALNAGRTVTHDEIRAALWDGRTVSFSGSTHVTIRQIRAVLGDDANAPSFIETVPREGYRFVAPVTVRSGNWKFRIALAASVVIGALVLTAMILRPGGTERVMADTNENVRLGEYLLAQDDPNATRRALERFESALIDTPDDRRALAGAGRAALLMQDADSAASFAARVLAQSPDDAAALEIRGHVAMVRDQNWDAARRDLDRALTLQPDLAPAHHSMAALLILSGDHDAALAHMAAARTLDPASTLIRADLGWMQYYARRYGEAAANCEEASRLHPAMTTFRYCVIRASDEARDAAPALPHITWLMGLSEAGQDEIDGVLSAPDPTLAFDQWRYGRYRSADRADPVPPLIMAMTGVLAGEPERALSWLLVAADAGDPGLPFAVIDPAFAPLHGDARFERLRVRFTPQPSEEPQITDWSGLRAAPSR